MCERHKVCAILGHRKIEVDEELRNRIYSAVCDLIQNKGVNTFLFGSKSEFNDLCYDIVLDLKHRFDICMCFYPCRHEAFISFDEKQEIEQWFKRWSIKAKVLAFDRAIEFEDRYESGKASYIKRNYAMIDGSDYCLFYYSGNPNSIDASGKITNSGTNKAYTYALKRNKTIINLYEPIANS